MDRLHYFAPDGNFGDAAGMTIVDTTDWADSDFEFVEKVKTANPELDLPNFARLMTEWISGETLPNDCVKMFDHMFGITEDELRSHYGEVITPA